MMILEQGGISTEVTNPADIALYKRRGWVEVKPEEVVPSQAESIPEEKNQEAVNVVNSPKGKGKVKNA